MPALDKPLAEIQEYRGGNPRPRDFDAYWEKALVELDATKPEVEMIPVEKNNSDAKKSRRKS
jgi:cephalosporin-C deacetylase